MTEVQNVLQLSRTVNASRETVWRAWTDPQELVHWWWPERFGTTYEVDLRVGGAYRFRTVDLPDMGVLSVTGTFLEIEAPERLVYSWHWEGADDEETTVRVEFLESGNATEIRITHGEFAAEEDRRNHTRGWSDCLDRLQGLFAD